MAGSRNSTNSSPSSRSRTRPEGESLARPEHREQRRRLELDLGELLVRVAQDGNATTRAHGRPGRRQHDTSDDHGEVDPPVEAEVSECAGVNAARMSLERI